MRRLPSITATALALLAAGCTSGAHPSDSRNAQAFTRPTTETTAQQHRAARMCLPDESDEPRCWIELDASERRDAPPAVVDPAVVDPAELVVVHRYLGCRSGADVVHIAVVGGGHVPPPELGVAEVLWELLASHERRSWRGP